MKKAQAIIALSSFLLLGLALIFNYTYLLYIALVGIIIATIIKQIRLYGKETILGHPERKKYKNFDNEDDFIDIDSDGNSDD